MRSEKLLNFTTMSLWDWLLAAFVCEKVFDNDSNKKSRNDLLYDDSFRDCDYDDNFDDDFL